MIFMMSLNSNPHYLAQKLLSLLEVTPNLIIPHSSHLFSQSYVHNYKIDLSHKHILDCSIHFMNMYLQNNIKGGEKKVVQEDNDLDKNTVVLYVPK